MCSLLLHSPLSSSLLFSPLLLLLLYAFPTVTQSPFLSSPSSISSSASGSGSAPYISCSGDPSPSPSASPSTPGSSSAPMPRPEQSAHTPCRREPRLMPTLAADMLHSPLCIPHA